MDWTTYKKKAEKLALRVEAAYNLIGGSFIFFWVHDVSSFRMGYAATNHYLHPISDQASVPLREFFNVSCKDYVYNNSGLNFWSIGVNTGKLIVTAPQSTIDSRRRATERKRQPGLIMNRLNELEEEGLPFVFFYLPLAKAAGDEVQPIIRVFPETHSATLLGTDGWKAIMNTKIRTLPPPFPWEIAKRTHPPSKRQRLLQSAPSRRNNTAEGNLEIENLCDRSLQPLNDAGAEDDVPPPLQSDRQPL